MSPLKFLFYVYLPVWWLASNPPYLMMFCCMKIIGVVMVAMVEVVMVGAAMVEAVMVEMVGAAMVVMVEVILDAATLHLAHQCC